MNNYEVKKQSQYKTTFFLVKILTLFFCSVPFFQQLVTKSSSTLQLSVELSPIVVTLTIFIIILFVWLIMDYDRKQLKWLMALEVLVFYVITTTSVYFSGSYQSYYKFLYLFIIISYTIEYGAVSGIVISFLSSASILLMDIFFAKDHGINQYFQQDLSLCAMFIIISWVLGIYVKIELRHIEDLKQHVNLDGLTEVYNHRYFQEAFMNVCRSCAEKKIPVSLVMMDIDYFKTFNDLYGHQKGDNVLKVMANILKENVDGDALVCRYGGEEFSIILPGKTQDQAVSIADRLRKFIQEYPFDGEEHLPNGKLTVSIGVAQLEDENDTFTNVIYKADTALYRAKYFRKNRVETYVVLFEQFNDIDKYDTKSEAGIYSLRTLITVINSRDRYTYSHIERVVYFCNIFADYLGLSTADKKTLIYAAYLHDLGKINIAKEILIKDTKLTDDEWNELKKHPFYSTEIIQQIDGLSDVIPVVLQHHEKYDGTGYPNGVAGQNISYLARILTVVDCFDAMTNKRPYQRTKTYDEAYAEIRRCAGTHFDPILSEKFLEALFSLE